MGSVNHDALRFSIIEYINGLICTGGNGGLPEESLESLVREQTLHQIASYLAEREGYSRLTGPALHLRVNKSNVDCYSVCYRARFSPFPPGAIVGRA